MKRLVTMDVVAVMVSVGLLAAVAVERRSVEPPDDASGYHERVRLAAEGAPPYLGDWAAREMQVPYEAISLLRPNVLLSRQFVNVANGRRVSLLLVHCQDARDLVGHYPPNCYPGQGWQLTGSEDRDWTLEDWSIAGTEYSFRRDTFNQSNHQVVSNFMVLPDGTTMRDMNAVRMAAASVQRRFYGAAQVQVVFEGSMPIEQREEIFKLLVTGHWPIIDAIRSGVSR
jgi:hypothetical protein